MKIACYILSFYFIALSGVACADTIPEDSQNSVTIVDIGNPGHNHHSTNGWDGCTPFCVCHCCHLHFFPASGVVFSHPLKLPQVYSSFRQDFGNLKLHDFLKPPRA
ncbi:MULTISPECIES: DUF6660 family protein [Echinicola]|uniref:Uncharacterized protein n=1 Tax=Echinicola vietnamensis (strain DSM 17526 / LMG 23754 / KMM 6221) TaxID=926556 RepID=L0G5N4_ECHVK|nr:DUF6660 family protein [Echinicola rosea]AGA80321.1 hypothetical protein Echvi_4119 [Echinicola vietnamensis DSM 17526]